MQTAAVVLTLMAAVGSAQAGIEAFGETKMTEKSVKVQISEPSVVSVAKEPLGWGYHQFPSIARWDDGRIAVTYSLSADAAESYGKSGGGMLVSSDGGKTWQPPSGKPGVSGLLLPNGDWISVSTPIPYQEKDLSLPKPVGIIGESYGSSKMTMYRLSELQPKLATIRISRLKNGANKRVVEHAWLDDPQALRYTLRGIFPIVWWGDVHIAADDSLVAGIYPGYRVRDDGTMDDKDGVFFYRSTDFGHSWKIQGRIPYQYDLKADPKGDKRGGFTEPAYMTLKDGSFLCVMRVTDGQGIGPMYASWSSDLGKTWTKPKAFTPNGVLPKLLRLENGMLVLASGRPGVQLRFSADGKGKKWSEPFDLVPISSDNVSADTCGYTSLVATGPDTFLIAYSHFKHLNENGEPRKAILVREVQVSSAK